MNEFQHALDNGDAQTVKWMLHKNPELLEEPDDYGRRPLMQAVAGMDRTLACVRVLIDAGADVNAATEEGYTALHFVVDFLGDISPDTEPTQFVQLLAQSGANLEARQHWGWTPLMRAVLEGTAKETQALLAIGANPDVIFPQNTLPRFLRGHTLLMKTVSDRVKLPLLLGAGADASMKDDYGQTALEFAKELLSEAEDEGYIAEVRDCIRILEAAPKSIRPLA